MRDRASHRTGVDARPRQRPRLSPVEQPKETSLERIRASLVVRLYARRAEIEEAILARVREVPDPVGDGDAEYAIGLRAAVTAAVDHGLTGIEQGEAWSGPAPQAAALQARRAACHGVSLDTVLRRYAAGDRLLGEFVMDEAEHYPRHALREILRTQGALVDRLMASIATEYMHEVNRAAHSPAQRRVECVHRLLGGLPADPAELGYELDAWHLGVIAVGPGATRTLERLAECLGCQLLSVPRSDHSAWAWLGCRRSVPIADVGRILSTHKGRGPSLAVGEPGRGLDGWRMTHWQAQRTLWVVLRRPRPLTRYADVLLLAPVVRDEVLARSLEEIFLAPLRSHKKGGVELQKTLRIYFAVGCNAATAAAALNVDRHTVERRVHRIEGSLGRALHTCQTELEMALRLESLNGAGSDVDSATT